MTASLSDLLGGDVQGAPAGQGGTPLVTLARGLVERGRRVTVCSLDPAVTHGTVSLRGDRLTVRYAPYRSRRHMRDGMAAERAAVRDLVAAARPDVVNAHWSYEYALGALAAGFPTLVTVHDWGPAVLRHNPTPYWAARQAMYLRAVRSADALTAVSPYLCDKLRRVVRRTAALIPDGLEPVWFAEERCEPDMFAPVVLSVNSGFTPLKNVTTLLEAFALVRRVLPACRLTLVGPGFEPGGAAAQWAAPRRLAAGVDFAGVLSPAGVRELMRASSVLAHPSREESFGMPLIEAMACRTPVMGGATSGAVPWILDEGRAGVLTDVTSPSSIAAAAVVLLQDSDLWRRYSRAGHRRAAAYYSSERVVAQYLEAYDRLVTRTRR